MESVMHLRRSVTLAPVTTTETCTVQRNLVFVNTMEKESKLDQLFQKVTELNESIHVFNLSFEISIELMCSGHSSPREMK